MSKDNQQIIDNAKEALRKKEITPEQYRDAVLLAMTNEADQTLESVNLSLPTNRDAE